MSIECRNLHFSYPINAEHGKGILRGITHRFEAGQATLITGSTGSGKSTLLHLMAGLMRPTCGGIFAGSQPISRWVSRHLDLWRRNVGLIFQEPQLLPDFTVMENMAAPLIPLRRRRREVSQMVAGILNQLDLAHLAAQSVNRLSGGERQRVTIGRALIAHPPYLLADEPTAFQDETHASAVSALFEAKRNQGACVVICSHDDRLCKFGGFDAVLRLVHGRLERVS